MSSKKNAREKRLARQAAEKKAKDAAFRRKGISIGMLLIGMAIVFFIAGRLAG